MFSGGLVGLSLAKQNQISCDDEIKTKLAPSMTDALMLLMLTNFSLNLNNSGSNSASLLLILKIYA